MPSYVSLFCGCGGIDLGFNLAGYDCLGAYDLDHTAVSTYNHNFGPRRAVVADLSGNYLTSSSLRPDIVVAGPPCQGFSTIGPRNPKDARNQLLLKPVDFAVTVKPKVLLIENVRGVLSGPHSLYWRRATSRLRRHGYTTATLEVLALCANLAQIRRRVILVAARRGFSPPPSATPTTARALRAVLDIAPGVPNHDPRELDPTSRAGRIAAHIAPGQKLSNVRNGSTSIHTWDIPDVFGEVTSAERDFLQEILILRRRNRIRKFGDADPVPYSILKSRFGSSTSHLLTTLLQKQYVRQMGPTHYDLRATFNGKFRRLHPDRPAHCVLTKFCDPSHFLHPFERRAFTIREAARLQGFPDSFRFLGSPTQQAVQVGNAVPPPVALFLARWIRTELL